MDMVLRGLSDTRLPPSGRNLTHPVARRTVAVEVAAAVDSSHDRGDIDLGVTGEPNSDIDDNVIDRSEQLGYV